MKPKGEILKFKSDDPCPCGSGEKFGDCCQDKELFHGHRDFTDSEFELDQSLLNQRIDAVLRYTYENIITFWNKRGKIERERGLETLKIIHTMADQILQPFLTASSCRTGCNYCCYLLIRITAIEAEFIRRHLQEQFDGSLMSEIREKIDAVKKYFPEPVEMGSEYSQEMLDSYFHLKVPCPFLSEKGLCMVYSSRPLICRTHMAFSDPELCNSIEPVAMYDADYLPQLFTAIAILSKLVFEDIDYEKHMAHWFVEEFRF